jgi:hypothetical protein
MSHPTKTLDAYMNEVLEGHVIAENEEEVILDVSAEEAEGFGLFTIRFVAGFFRGLKRVRFLHELAEREKMSDEVAIDEEEIDEGKAKKAFMN